MTLGAGKSAAYGDTPTLTNWHGFFSGPAKFNINTVKRAAHGSNAPGFSGTGGRTFSASLDVEPTSGTVEQFLAWAMGGQTAPSTTIVNTTFGANASIGATTIQVASSAGIFPGMTLTLGTGGTLETAVVSPIPFTAVNTVSLTAALTKAHALGDGVVNTTAGAHMSTFSAGTLPSFMLEANRPGSLCTDYLGCKVNQMTLGIQAKQALSVKLAIPFQKSVTNGSPTTASLSSKDLYIYEQQLAPAQIGGELCGVGSGASLLSFSLSANNNLMLDDFTFGSGPYNRDLPEQMRDYSAQITMYLDSLTAYNNFQAAASGGSQVPISILIPLMSTSTIGATGIPYSASLYMPKVFLSGWAPSDDTTKAITQTLTVSMHESAPGLNDQLQIIAIGSNTTIY
jgi:hypothetical protein